MTSWFQLLLCYIRQNIIREWQTTFCVFKHAFLGRYMRDGMHVMHNLYMLQINDKILMVSHSGVVITVPGNT